MRLHKLFLMIMILYLTGCATNQKFDCPYHDGVRCLSLSEVDKRIDRGQINDGSKDKNLSLKKLEFRAVPPSPLRSPEEVLSVWIGPYQTEDGSLHEEKRIHFVAKPATWVGANPEIKEGNG